MSVSNEILTTTLRILKDQEVDQLFKATPLLNKLAVEKVDGGSRYEQPVVMTEHSVITQLSSGQEPFDTTAANIFQDAIFEWCDYVAPVTIERKYELSNAGSKKVVSIAEARMRNVIGSMKREWEKQVLAGSSTVLTELQTMQGVDAGTGWFEEAAFGSQVNSVGGLSKSTYADSNWQNQVANGGGALTISIMSGLALEMGNYTDQGQLDLVIGSPDFWKAYRDLLSTQERWGSADKLDGGRMAIMFNGAPVISSAFLPVTGGSGTVLSAYFLNTSYLKAVFHKEAYFDMDDFVKVDGYVARRSLINVRTQLVISHLASQGLLYAAEA